MKSHESNPNGGLLARFGDPSLPPLTIPSLGITFSGAAPADTPWDTAIYTAEYDGFADFPSYPINLLSDLNAFLGIALVHGAYDDFTAEQMAATVKLPVSDDYTGHTQYFMIPVDSLPLLEPVRLIPVIGNPLADLLEPDLRVLVNLGYGNIEHGWDPGPANLPTPFGLFPNVNPADVFTALVDGTQKGIQNFTDDLGSMTPQHILAELTAGGGGAGTGGDGLPSLVDIVNSFSGALASGYSALLPTADVITALTTTLPVYDVSLFLHGLSAGNLLDAIGLPIAATNGLGVLAGMTVLGGLVTALTGVIESLNP